MPYVHPVVVRWRDCDSLAHVNNAVYLTYFEEARGHFYRDMMGDAFRGYDFLIAEALVAYKSPATCGEAIDVAIRVARVGGKSWDLVYTLTARRDGRVVATGRTVQVQFDHAAQATIPIPDEVRERLAQRV